MSSQQPVIVAAGPRDTDEVRRVGHLLGDLLDRGGFTVADASSGRPEPEHGRLVGQRRRVHLAATDERCPELQRGRNGDRLCGRGRLIGRRLVRSWLLRLGRFGFDLGGVDGR